MLLVVGGSVSVTTCQKDLQQVCQQLVTMSLFHHAAGTKLSLFYHFATKLSLTTC